MDASGALRDPSWTPWKSTNSTFVIGIYGEDYDGENITHRIVTGNPTIPMSVLDEAQILHTPNLTLQPSLNAFMHWAWHLAKHKKSILAEILETKTVPLA
jgi:hypothetical protein